MENNALTLVELQPIDGEAKPVTTSLKVAEYFEKEHRNVLRDIREVIEKSSADFGRLNFEQSSYVNEQNKEQPMYLLTRDGFTMVAMGYTGEKAMQFKEAYINAFNDMERKLTGKGRHGIDEGELKALTYFYETHCGATGNQLVRALDRACQHLGGFSPIAIGAMHLADSEEDDLAHYVPVTKIAEMFGISARKLNPILTGLGLQEAKQKYRKKTRRDGTVVQKPCGYDYLPTELGIKHGGKRVSNSASHDVHKEVWACMWHDEKLPAYLRANYFDE